MFIVEKNFPLTKKILKLECKIFIPILTVLTLIKWLKTKQILEGDNYYSLFLLISILFILFDLIGKFLSKYFICYSMNNIYFDERNYRYVLFTFFSILTITFIGIATIMFFINDFIVNLGLF
jgi:hypothetical protein